MGSHEGGPCFHKLENNEASPVECATDFGRLAQTVFK